MKSLMKPKHQYFLLPLTYIYICVVASINYKLWGNTSKSIKTILTGVIISVIFLIFIPFVVYMSQIRAIFEGIFWYIYFYSISTIAGIYFINEQNKYLSNCSKN